MAKVFLVSANLMGVLYVDKLLEAGDEIVGIAAWPGAGGWHVPPEADLRAKAFREYLPLYEPDPKDINSLEFVEVMRKAEPDYVISGYYARIFKDQILSLPKKGCINIHPTGLPKFRGLSPTFTHMLHGDTHSYSTMHWLNPGIDTGDIIAQTSVEILSDDTGWKTSEKLTIASGEMFAETWPLVKAGKAPRVVQDESIASVFNFSWKMAQIDWTKTSLEIFNLVRALTKPMKGTWTFVSGRKMHIWKASMVPVKGELSARDALPGEVLAVTGKGLWVQCGKGQVQILDYTFDDDPQATVADYVCTSGVRVLLG